MCVGGKDIKVADWMVVVIFIDHLLLLFGACFSHHTKLVAMDSTYNVYVILSSVYH